LSQTSSNHLSPSDSLSPLHTKALLESFQTSLLLETPEATPFDKSKLPFSEKLPQLNLSQKLGHLCEDALAHLLENSPHYDLLARNIQIQEGKHHTIGEIDYLIKDLATQDVIHLELAMKFYLAVQRTDGTWIYPGPNSTDNWPSKLARLRHHQFTLSQHPATRALFKDRFHFNNLPKVQHLICGRLFHHIAQEAPPPPEYAVSEIDWKPWLYGHEWADHLSAHQEILLIPKHLWAAHLCPELLATLPRASHTQLMKLAEQRCVMFTLTDGFHPHFLVPDLWPNDNYFQKTTQNHN